jgi:hypothetical protein
MTENAIGTTGRGGGAAHDTATAAASTRDATTDGDLRVTHASKKIKEGKIIEPRVSQ